MNDQTKKQIGFAIFTFFIYTLLVNWKAALLLTIGVGFHEYSHLLAAKYMGMKTKGFYLVPFMGGVAFVEGKYKSLGQQAFVVLAGPAGGGLLALVTAGAYLVTGVPFLAAAASWMCLLNLFNLLPLSSMDGGQLMGTITYSINRTLGMVCMVISNVVAAVIMWKVNMVLFALVLLFGGISVVDEIRNWNYFRKGMHYMCSENYLHPPKKLSGFQMFLTIAGWVGTFVILAFAMYMLKFTPNSNINVLVK